MPAPIPVQKFKAWNITRGRLEFWEATSLDGKWHFERVDGAAGTPWIVTHTDFPGWQAEFGSLPKARKLAERQLEFDLTLGLEQERVWNNRSNHGAPRS